MVFLRITLSFVNRFRNYDSVVLRFFSKFSWILEQNENIAILKY